MFGDAFRQSAITMTLVRPHLPRSTITKVIEILNNRYGNIFN